MSAIPMLVSLLFVFLTLSCAYSCHITSLSGRVLDITVGYNLNKRMRREMAWRALEKASNQAPPRIHGTQPRGRKIKQSKSGRLAGDFLDNQ